MRLIGLLTAAVVVLGAFGVLWSSTLGLPPDHRAYALLPPLVLAVIMGLIYASAVARRRRSGSDVALFAGISLVVTCGIVGGAVMLSLTAAYLTTFAGWPSDLLDQILIVLAYPVFTLLGVALGCLGGLLLGAVVGGVLRLALGRR